jgi:hypothetical protein
VATGRVGVRDTGLAHGDGDGIPPRPIILRAAVSLRCEACDVVTVDDVRALATTLPRSEEHLVRDRVKFRIGRIVYLAFSRDEELMGFAFPKEEREALVASEPATFLMPGTSDLRYNWVVVRLAAIDHAEMRELVLDAWRMCVPKKVAAAYDLNAASRGTT